MISPFDVMYWEIVITILVTIIVTILMLFVIALFLFVSYRVLLYFCLGQFFIDFKRFFCIDE